MNANRSSPPSDLLRAEYESCRQLLSQNIEIIERTETYAVGAVAAVIVFATSGSASDLKSFAPTATLLISVLGYLRFLGVDRTIDIINSYLVHIEETYSELGWTKHYRAKNKPKILKLTRHAFWWVLILVSAFMICKGFS